MTIHIEDLKFQCIIGILDFEREKEQDIIINIILKYQYDNQFLNYADIVDFIKKTMISHKFELIEEALENLNLNLNKEFKSLQSLDIKITKPSILSDCKVSVSKFYQSQS